MNCVRCEIARAKIRTVWLFNLGNGADEIVFDLNGRYSGVYGYTIEGDLLRIWRKVTVEAVADVHIATFTVAEPKLNNVF